MNVVSLVFINKSDFISCIKNFPEDYEKFCMMQDNINLYKNSRGLGLKCPSCHEFSHLTIDQCPFFNYIPRKEDIINRYNLESEQDQRLRKKIERKRKRNENSLLTLDCVKDCIVEYIIDNY